MSKNRKVEIEFVRNDRDKHGKEIPVYRQKITYLTKAEVQAAREEVERRGRELYEAALKAKQDKEAKNGENSAEQQEIVHNESA